MNIIEIKTRIENARALDFGTIFSESIDLFKKVWVQGLIMLLLNIVLAIPIIMIVYIPLILFGLADVYASSNAYDPYGSSGQPEISVVLGLVMAIVYVFLIIAMSSIGLGLKAAFYRICKYKDLGQIGREDYFYFFKKPYLGKTIKLGMAFSGISLLAALLCLVPLIYVIVPMSFLIVIYAFNPDLTVSDMVKLAFHLGNKKWLISFGLFFVSWILAFIIGALMCGVGIYVTASFNYLWPYLIYKKVVGFDDESEQLRRIEQLSTV